MRQKLLNPQNLTMKKQMKLTRELVLDHFRGSYPNPLTFASLCQRIYWQSFTAQDIRDGRLVMGRERIDMVDRVPTYRELKEVLFDLLSTNTLVLDEISRFHLSPPSLSLSRSNRLSFSTQFSDWLD